MPSFNLIRTWPLVLPVFAWVVCQTPATLVQSGTASGGLLGGAASSMFRGLVLLFERDPALRRFLQELERLPAVSELRPLMQDQAAA